MSSNTTTQAQPLTVLTTWERHEAGYPPRDTDERQRYRELDQAGGPHEANGNRGRPMRVPGPDDRRWTWAVATQLLENVLENAGYRRCDDDTHVGQALHLLHLAARIYAGETRSPSGSSSRPQLSIGQSVAVDTARHAIAAFDSTGGTEGFLAVLGEAPERDRVARCARAFGIAVADLRRVLSVVDDLTGGVS